MSAESTLKGWMLYWLTFLVPMLIILANSSRIFAWVDSIYSGNGGN